MSLIRRRRIALALENMSQMPPTIRANNLRPRHSKSLIRMSCDRAWNAVEERRPAAARLEFVVGFVEGRVASDTVVGSLCGEVFVVFAGEGGFGSFFADHAELFRRENGLPFLIGLCDWVRHIL